MVDYTSPQLGLSTHLRALTLHEIGHVLGICHTWMWCYGCPSGEEDACFETPYYDDFICIDSCNMPNRNPSSPVTQTCGDFYCNRSFNPLEDTPLNNNCASGLWLYPGHKGSAPWRFPNCDDPEEITNNIMDYFTDLPGGGRMHWSDQQIQVMQNRISMDLPNYVYGLETSTDCVATAYTQNFDDNSPCEIPVGWSAFKEVLTMDGTFEWMTDDVWAVGNTNLPLGGDGTCELYIDDTGFENGYKHEIGTNLLDFSPYNLGSVTVSMDIELGANNTLRIYRLAPTGGKMLVEIIPGGYSGRWEAIVPHDYGFFRLYLRLDKIAGENKVQIDNLEICERDIACFPPTNLTAHCINETTATLNWDPRIHADYTLQYRPVGTTTWATTAPLMLPSTTLTFLTPCTEYEAQISATCFDCPEMGASIPTDFSAPIFFTTSGDACGEEDDMPVEIIASGLACEGEVITLYAGAGFNDYEWSTGEGTQTITVTESGIYTVSVTDYSNGYAMRCSNSDDIEIIFNPAPQVELQAYDNPLCDGQTTILSTWGIVNGIYEWSTGEGFMTIEVAEAGIYALTVTDANGCAASDEIEITVSANPTLDLGNDIEECTDDPITLNAANPDYVTYQWGAGQTTETINVIISDTYTLTVTDANGCTASDEVVVTLYDNPVLDIGSDIEVCTNAPIVLNAASPDFATYAWSGGETTASISIAQSGVYALTVTDADGCTASDEISVILHPEPALSITGDFEFCADYAGILSADLADATYLWSTGEVTQQIEPAVSGAYSVTVTDANGCTAIDEVSVSVYPFPDFNITGDPSYCTGEAALLIADIAGVDYFWSTGATTQQIEPTSMAFYSVTVTNANGCTAAASVTVTEDALPPTPEITVGNPNGDCTLTLSGPAGYAAYEWLLEDGSPVGAGNPITVDVPDTYKLIITDSNGCQNVNGVTLADLDFVNFSIWSDLTPLPNALTLWNAPQNIRGMVHVGNGQELNITGTTVTFLDETSGIWVESGGILRINNSTLDANPCVGQYWEGIRVEAESQTEAHPDEAVYLAGGSPDHGTVIITNGSAIRNARTAVNSENVVLPGEKTRGGGIVYAANSTFQNNQTGISIRSYYPKDYSQRSKISDCTFTNSAPFAGTGLSGSYIHVLLSGSGLVPIVRNTFETLPSSGLTMTEKGTGIRATGTAVYIGDKYTGTPRNVFNNLFVGVEMYELYSASTKVVLRNDFINVNQGINMSSAPFVSIRRNTFDIPAGTGTHVEQTHGIYAIKSFGFEISDNDFSSFANSGNQFTKGMVLESSYFEKYNESGNRSLVYDNELYGFYGAATQFSGDNQLLQLNCNGYYAGNLSDWYLDEDSRLDDQGECDADNAGKSFSTHWHNIPTAMPVGSDPNPHIVNNGDFTLRINYDNADSEPTALVGNFDLHDCSAELGFAIDNTSCNIADPPVGGIDITAICFDPDADISKWMRHLLEEGYKDDAIALLVCINKEWAYKVLVGTYIDEKHFDLAVSALDSIPDDTPENIDFKAIYQAILDGLGEGGSGKAEQEAEENVRRIADAPTANRTLAESALATYKGTRYVRATAPLRFDLPEKNDAEPTFELLPNPTSGTATAYFKLPPDAGEEFLLHDLTGKFVQRIPLAQGQRSLQLTDLRAGVYLCKLKGKPGVVKLAVIK